MARGRTSPSTPSRDSRRARLSITACQPADGESKEANDRAEPAHHGSDVRGERELAKAGSHGQSRSMAPEAAEGQVQDDE